VEDATCATSTKGRSVAAPHRSQGLACSAKLWFAAALLLVVMFAAGLLAGTQIDRSKASSCHAAAAVAAAPVPSPLPPPAPPLWPGQLAPLTLGDWWVYAMRGDDWEGERLLRLVLADITSYDFMLASASLDEAAVHAVLNYVPFIGRITRGELAIFEEGAEQHISALPRALHDDFVFRLYGAPWNGTVSASSTVAASVAATSTSGGALEYTHERRDGMLSSLAWRAAPAAPPKLTLRLVSRGSGFQGTAYFLRARDLFDGRWSTDPVAPADATFATGVHPKHGEWDALAVWATADLTSGKASVSVASGTTHDGTNVAVERTWGPRAVDANLATTIVHGPLASDYAVRVKRDGAEGDVALRVSGVKIYQYAVPP
jgi:hypothetical protein